MSARWRALGGTFFLLLVGLLTAPADAAWRRAESDNFIIYGDMSESGLRRRAEQLEDFDRLLRMMTSVDAPAAANKLHVYIVSGLDDLRVLRPVASGTGGFYAATPDGIAAIVDGRAPFEQNEVLFHEYAHHFMMQYAPNAYPAWYVEGFAEYFMTASFAPQRVEVGRASPGRAYSIVLDRWLPAERVLFEDASGLSLEQKARFYAQSWLTAHYFFSNTERRSALQRYLAGIRTGDPRAAFRTATGVDPAEFNETLEDYIAGGRINFRRLTREAPAPVAVAITAMPASADDLILYEAALRLGVADENRASYLARIRTAAAEYQGDPYAMRVLAHAEALFGDGAAADRLLDSADRRLAR